MEKLQDLKIAGMTKMNGGKFDVVYITGVGKIFGDLEANSIHISGTGNIEGNIKAVKVDIEGTGKAEGNMECEQLDISGTVKLEGELIAGILNCNGICKIKGAIESKRIFSHGVLKSSVGVEAEEIECEGAIEVNGLLNANIIDIRVGFPSSVKEIGGDKITVKRAKQMGFGFPLSFLGKSKSLKVELIEGTNISLECTDAKVVRGQNVKIGTKCVIELIEYSGELEIDSSSVVKNRKKI